MYTCTCTVHPIHVHIPCILYLHLRAGLQLTNLYNFQPNSTYISTAKKQNTILNNRITNACICERGKERDMCVREGYVCVRRREGYMSEKG